MPKATSLTFVVGFVCLVLLNPVRARGQNLGSQYPSQRYYDALSVYRSGDLGNALNLFDQAHGSTRLSAQGRWIDSIPVYAMEAECYWHLGDLERCNESLAKAMAITIRHRGWLARVDWDNALRPAATSNAASARLWPAAASIIELPIANQLPFRAGDQITEDRVRLGGTLEGPSIRSVDILEIMRGIASVAHRRRILLGPLAQNDPLASELLEMTKYPASVKLPIALNLIGAMRGAEYFGARNDKSANDQATKTTLFNGGVHPVSPILLLCQAQIVAKSQNPSAAIQIALQCVNVAAKLDQDEWVGEALQLAAGCAQPNQAPAVQQAALVAATSMSRRSRLAALHCLVAAADAAVTAGDLTAANNLMDQARAMSARRDVQMPRVEAYGAFVGARLATASGESIGGIVTSNADKAVANITSFALNHRSRNRRLISMPRLFQLASVGMRVGSNLGGTTSDKLIEQYLQPAPAHLWRRDPVDALSTQIADKSSLESAWINLATLQSDGKELMRRTDFVLESRFNRSLPLGGRLAQVRLLTSTSKELWSPELKGILTKPPQSIIDFRTAAAAAPPADAAAKSTQATQLESLASQIALQRISLPHSVLGRIDATNLGKMLPQRTGVLTFLVAGNRTLATLTGDGVTKAWSIGGTSRLPSEIASLLRTIGVGVTRGNRLPEAGDQKWRESAAKLFARLLPVDETDKLSDRFDQLVIVPDGALWYLPFELLPTDRADSELLGDLIQIRYAATPGLAIHPVAQPTTNRTIGVAASKFFVPGDAEENEVVIEELMTVLDNPVRLPGDSRIPASLTGDSFGHLFVAAPVTINPTTPLLTSVAAYDAGTQAGSVAAWMRYPQATPQTVVLSGHRSAVDSGRIGNGHEIFLTLCGLHAAGVRDVLISRWAVGGRSTAGAMQELLQELPFTGLVDAWKRARGFLRRTELDPSGEPRLIQAEHDREDITGDEPLFWASYLITSPLTIPAQQ